MVKIEIGKNYKNRLGVEFACINRDENDGLFEMSAIKDSTLTLHCHEDGRVYAIGLVFPEVNMVEELDD